MINKQNLWFITLFSLIIILGIYYISIDDEVVSVLKEDKNPSSVIEVTDSDILVSLEVEAEEEKQALMEEYQNVLISAESTLEQKNDAYENIQKLSDKSSKEVKIKELIKEKHDLNSFVKINEKGISIVVSSSKHNNEIANNIIRTVQSLYEDEVYITVKFNN